ncbi:MAG: hypothetical protein PVI59_15410 [Anaerolineae bacterium]|jgi:gas vesicle protein
MKGQRDIASFVLRFTQDLWEDAQGEPHVQWRGHIQHVQGDDETHFTDFAEAVTFVQRQLMELTLHSLEDSRVENREKVLRKSFEIWEEFASSYANVMFEAVDQTVEWSGAFQERVERAVHQALDALRPPSDEERIQEGLSRLHGQMQRLAEKIDQLEGKEKDQAL